MVVRWLVLVTRRRRVYVVECETTKCHELWTCGESLSHVLFLTTCHRRGERLDLASFGKTTHDWNRLRIGPEGFLNPFGLDGTGSHLLPIPWWTPRRTTPNMSLIVFYEDASCWGLTTSPGAEPSKKARHFQLQSLFVHGCNDRGDFR